MDITGAPISAVMAPGNSPMEACVVICRTAKRKARRGKILLINPVSDVTHERAQSFVPYEQIERVVKAYTRFKDEPGFTSVATLEVIRARDANLSIPLYVALGTANAANGANGIQTGASDFALTLAGWFESSAGVHKCLHRASFT